MDKTLARFLNSVQIFKDWVSWTGCCQGPYTNTNTIVYSIHNPQVHKLQKETNIIIIHTCNDEQQALHPYNFLTLIVIDKMAIIWRIYFVKNTFYRQHISGENC